MRQGLPVVGLVRSAERAKTLPSGTPFRIASYDDLESLSQAFADISAVLFISGDGNGRDVLRQHANVIDAVAMRNVSSIVFTSIIDIDSESPFYYAPVYRDAERRLSDSAVNSTILRCGLYSDFVLDQWLKPALPTGTLSLPVGAAKIAPISRDDVALAAAAAVSSPLKHVGNTYELTGQKSLSFQELADVVATASGRPLDFIACSPADYLQHAWAELEDPWPHAFSSLCRSIAEGRYERTSDGYERLLGRPAKDFRDFGRRVSFECP